MGQGKAGPGLRTQEKHNVGVAGGAKGSGRSVGPRSAGPPKPPGTEKEVSSQGLPPPRPLFTSTTLTMRVLGFEDPRAGVSLTRLH